MLNITNGDYFNRYFLEKLNIDYIGNAFPFREAMIDGPAHADVFSTAFICTRAQALSVDEHFYKEKAKELLDFCEVRNNILLAYLETSAVMFSSEILKSASKDENSKVNLTPMSGELNELL